MSGFLSRKQGYAGRSGNFLKKVLYSSKIGLKPFALGVFFFNVRQ